MTKRLLTLEPETDLLGALPSDVLERVVALLEPGDLERCTRAQCRPLVQLAQCNRRWHGTMELSDMAALTWCLMCRLNQGTTPIACAGGSHCALEVTLGDTHRAYSAIDAQNLLCDACCAMRCQFCFRGNCGCDSDFSSCDDCGRDICSVCQCDKLVARESGRLLCVDCASGRVPSASDDDELWM